MSRPYSISVKRSAIDLYEQGYGCTTISQQLGVCKAQVTRWLTHYRTLGGCWLDGRPPVKTTAARKAKLVREVLEKSLSCDRVALQNGVSSSALYSWVDQVRKGGYEALLSIRSRGRPPKTMGRPRKKEAQTELEKLQYENECLRTEVALLKKVKALVEARDAQRPKIGRKPSKH